MILKKDIHHNIEIELQQMNCKIISSKKHSNFNIFVIRIKKKKQNFKKYQKSTSWRANLAFSYILSEIAIFSPNYSL